MSHSVVRDFPVEKDNTLVLVINKDGELNIDQETLEAYMKLGNTQVSIVRVDKEEGDTVDMTVETFDPSNTKMEELSIDVEDDFKRNLLSFQMDHCYTPLTSPSQQKPVASADNTELELDDLAQTLSLLEGSSTDTVKTEPKSPVINNKIIHKVYKGVNKTLVLNKQPVVKSDTIKSPPIKSSPPSAATVKSPPVLHKSPPLLKTKVLNRKQLHQQLDSDYDDDDDDDYNDEDFEVKNKRNYKRRVDEKKIRKPVKIKSPKPPVLEPKIVELKLEPKIEPSSSTSPTPSTPTTPESSKSPDSKKLIKKEKKVVKPPPVIDDGGLALFSTPDIIRRVGGNKTDGGGGKSEKTADSPESQIKRPAKIEARSDSNRSSTDNKIHKSPSKSERTSIDSKSEPRLSETKDLENLDLISQLPLLPETTAIDSQTFDSITQAVSNLENEIPVIASVPNLIASNPDFPTSQILDPNLDIGQAILDNINTDELIPEDILYQVAKLVENPDVQNVIDRTLVEALDPTIQNQIVESPQITQQMPVVSSPQIPQTPQINQQQIPLETNPNITKNTTSHPIKILRSDGRVLTLPPIEKPATRSSKKKQEPPAAQTLGQKQLQPKQLHLPKPVQQQHHVQQPLQMPTAQLSTEQPVLHQVDEQQKIETAVRLTPKQLDGNPLQQLVGSDIDTDSDESWNSEDDPDRLWCICKQPHNNRFMICCDTCEDWFHGKCVNITKAMGQQMEQQQKEWMCPNCVKKLNSPTTSTQQPSPNPIARKINKLGFGDSSHKRKSVDSTSTCIVCSAPSRANSVYCSDACILKHAQGVEKDTNKAQKNIPQRIIVFERSTGKCLSGPNAPSAANLKQWLKEHPGFEVVRPANKQQNLVQSKLSLVKNTPGKEGVALALNRKGVQVGVMPHSSKQQNAIKLIPAAKLNTPQTKPQQLAAAKTPTQPSPKPKLTQTTLKLSISPPKTVKTPQLKSDKIPPGRERKQKLHPQAETTSKQNAPESIRDNVKRTLYEQLMTRLKEAADLKLTEDEVDKMATEIEMQLCKLFNDVGPKYRAKYRSLIFNIKDTKNQTLWRRICEKDITPSQLVRLSPDEMASQELARWRERENKHQLDMIKKSELEMLSINRTYVLKTHKGEQVMEDRPTVKVDSSEIMPGLGADSTSEHDTSVLSDKADDHDRRSASKHSHRDKDKRTDRSISKDRHKSSKSSRSKRSRSRDRDRSSHRNDRKRSRSRDRHHRSHKSSRHKRDKYITEHLDKKSREILDNLENNKIVPPPEDRLWKHVPQQDIQVASPDSDSDHEPSSTVTIPTPPRCVDPEELSKTLGSPLDIPKVVEPKEVKPPRTDPRLVRETEIVPKTESPAPVVSLSPSTSPVPPAPPKFTSESKETIIWEGNINMVDVAKFFITLHEVSGDCSGLKTELPSTLEIVGRISPDTVWDYIGKMRKSNSKIISILRLTAGNVEEKMPYIALYSYLSSRNRLGVIKSTNNAVKDFYILPLASQSPLPQALLPLSGPGFEEQKPNLLLGIIVRAKRKRSSVDIISGGSISKRSRVEQASSELPSNVNNVSRSYTPPPTRDPRVRLPAIPAANDDDEPYSPEDSDPETTVVPTIRTNTTTIAAPIIKTTDITSVLNVALKLEPSKFDAIPGLDVDTGVNDLQRKMEELDKCIEKQKEEIQNISRDIVQSGAAANISTNLSSISLPSNLQQILDSIKNIPSTSAADGTEEYCPTTPGFKPTDDLTIPLLLPKLNARHAKSISTIPLQLPKAANRDPTPTTTETLILPNLSIPPPNLPSILPTMTSTAITLPTQIHPPGTTPLISDKEPKPVSVLSSLSEEDLIRKAAEMLGEAENESGRAESPEIDEITPVSGFSAVYTPTPTNQPPAKRTKLDDSQPPVPGLEDEYQD